MLIEVDLLGEVVLLLDKMLHVRDAFMARGPTSHLCDYPAVFYTYRSLLTMPDHCCVCGYSIDELDLACSSSGGFHAIVGASREIPLQHKAEARNLKMRALRYDEFTFFIESDNLFPIDQIQSGLVV